MAGIDVSKYAHSAVHKAVAMRDYASLRTIIAALPRLGNPAEIRTEAAALAEEEKADGISAVIDRRDVPNRDSPLHLAVKLSDETAVEMLMAAGVNWCLRNEQGWTAVEEAICNRDEAIAMIIFRHYKTRVWEKWRRRLPRFLGTMGRMRDFYMEITFHFESSVIPFISRIAPSDTYKIWKRGANLRADFTLAGFDGFRIQRADKSILVLGDGSEDGKAPPGSLCMISHKGKEVRMANALDGGGSQATEEKVRQEVVAMSRKDISRPGIDVTQAVLSPQLTWRRQEKAEMVGAWKAKVYDMHNVVFSIKSRTVPGATTASSENESESEELDKILTEDERRQLELALKSDSSEMSNENGDDIVGHHHSCYESREISIEESNGYKNRETKQKKKGWFSGQRRQSKHDAQRKTVPPRNSLCVDEKVSEDSSISTSMSSESGNQRNERKKGLKPILWLSPNFPLKTEELLPLLDILAHKVAAIRRLRELLVTKLPPGTFPVKVAIPVVPTIKVLVTFTKFEELQPLDEFLTPPSSPTAGRESPPRYSYNKVENVDDPFAIPPDYTWITREAKKKKRQEKTKSKKAESQTVKSG
ncbi:hypothetical protein DITRI_Ditri17bG0039700 [Diplodiscus trichospermus]